VPKNYESRLAADKVFAIINLAYVSGPPCIRKPTITGQNPTQKGSN